MAKYLDQYKHELPFDRIYLMVKQEMAQTRHGSKAIIQGADESNRLLKLLYFVKKQPQVLQRIVLFSLRSLKTHVLWQKISFIQYWFIQYDGKNVLQSAVGKTHVCGRDL